MDHTYQALWHADNSLEPDLALEGSAILAPLILPRVPSIGKLCLRCMTRLNGAATLESQSGRQVSGLRSLMCAKVCTVQSGSHCFLAC